MELRNSFKTFTDTIKSSVEQLCSSLGEVQVTELSAELLELNLTEMDREVHLFHCLSLLFYKGFQSLIVC